jgi:hypothetical protein
MDEDEQNVHNNAAMEMMMAYVLLKNSDAKRFGDAFRDIPKSNAYGTKHWPETLDVARKMLEKVKNLNDSNNEVAPAGIHSGHVKRKSEKSKPLGKSSACMIDTEQIELSFSNVEGRCHTCGTRGHFADTCPKKNNIPKKDWFWEKVKKKEETSHLNNRPKSYSAAASGEVGKAAGNTKWSFLMSSNMDEHTNLLHDGLNLREVILLDSQSTTNIFCNPEFVEDIRPADTPLCLNTNGGVLITNLKATVPSFGEVWFNPDAIANIFCMADIDDKYGMDWAIVNGKKAIRVMTDPPVDFVRSPEKLYFFAPKKFWTDTKLLDYTFVDSMEENRLFFTGRQFDRAKRARQLYHTLGSPSIKDFKGIVRMNCIRDNPVTTEDIEIAETIFGPDIGVLKGKSTHHRPTPVVADYVTSRRNCLSVSKM